MTGFIHVAMAVLSLLSVGESAPVTSCESLIQPVEIQGRDQLLGKWIYVAESTAIPASNLLTKMFVEGAWVEITAANESDAIAVFQAQKTFGRCITLSTKMTLVNNTLSTVQPYHSTAVPLSTSCPDCLVFHNKITLGGNTYNGLQLLSRRNQVTAAEQEEFSKQVECLNLSPPAILDPGKASCSDDTTQGTGTTDITSFMNNTNSEVVKLFDKLLSSKTGITTLLKMISSSVAESIKD